MSVEVYRGLLSLNECPIVRRGVKADAVQISKLITLSIEEFVCFEYTDSARRLILDSVSEDNIAKNIANEVDYWIADYHNKIIAVLGIKLPNHVFHYFVDKNYHRKGLANLLWKSCLEELRFDTATVYSSRYAIPFYQNLGFEFDGEQLEKNGVTCFPMKLLIKSA